MKIETYMTRIPAKSIDFAPTSAQIGNCYTDAVEKDYLKGSINPDDQNHSVLDFWDSMVMLKE